MTAPGWPKQSGGPAERVAGADGHASIGPETLRVTPFTPAQLVASLHAEDALAIWHWPCVQTHVFVRRVRLPHNNGEAVGDLLA